MQLCQNVALWWRLQRLFTIVASTFGAAIKSNPLQRNVLLTFVMVSETDQCYGYVKWSLLFGTRSVGLFGHRLMVFFKINFFGSTSLPVKVFYVFTASLRGHFSSCHLLGDKVWALVFVLFMSHLKMLREKGLMRQNWRFLQIRSFARRIEIAIFSDSVEKLQSLTGSTASEHGNVCRYQRQRPKS